MEFDLSHFHSMDEIKEFSVEWSKYCADVKSEEKALIAKWEKNKREDRLEAEKKAEEYNEWARTLHEERLQTLLGRLLQPEIELRSVESFMSSWALRSFPPRLYPSTEGFIEWLGTQKEADATK